MKNYFSAFTLIELLVTIAIIVLLLVVAIPAFNNYGQYNELYQLAQSFKSDILAAKNYALAPTEDKEKNVDHYIVRFFQQPNPINENKKYYEVLEESSPSQPAKLPLISSAAGSDYNLTILDPAASQLEIIYSISQRGKIVSPEGIIEIVLRLQSNRISADDNYVDIIINQATGQVALQPAWQ